MRRKHHHSITVVSQTVEELAKGAVEQAREAQDGHIN